MTLATLVQQAEKELKEREQKELERMQEEMVQKVRMEEEARTLKESMIASLATAKV